MATVKPTDRLRALAQEYEARAAALRLALAELEQAEVGRAQATGITGKIRAATKHRAAAQGNGNGNGHANGNGASQAHAAGPAPSLGRVIQQILLQADRPLTPETVWQAAVQIPFTTTSKYPRGLVNVLLTGMQKQDLVSRTKRGYRATPALRAKLQTAD